jgi:hypothetical protein
MHRDTGVILIVDGHPPGDALACYAVAYGIEGWLFEFLRGDPDRPYWLGFSQPQWISLFSICGIARAEMAGALAFRIWHSAAALVLAMAWISLRRRLDADSVFELVHPRHVRAISRGLELLPELASEPPAGVEWTIFPRQAPAAEHVHVARTFLGVQISPDLRYRKHDRSLRAFPRGKSSQRYLKF